MSMLKHLSWSLVGQVSTILFQFVGILVLTKLIPPSDYGIIGIITFFTNIADLFIDSGMGGALIYKKNPTSEDFSTLFFYNLGVSLLMYMALFFCARPIANFYDIPSLVPYVRIYGLSIIIIALCITQDCKLKRKMDFKSLSLISIVSNAISLCVAIVMAKKGMGVWALISQTLLFLVLRTIGLYVICGFNERYVFSTRSFKEQFSFGGWLFLANIIHSVSENLYANIFPKVGTLSQNGYYTQAAKISNVPCSTITLTVNNVFFPYFAKFTDATKLLKEARSLYRKVYHFSFPLFCLLAVVAYEIVIIVLGKQWVDATRFLKILLFAGPFNVVMHMLRNFLKSQGKTSTIATLEIIKSVIKLCCILASIFFGIEALIYSILFTAVLNCVVVMFFVARRTNYSFGMQFVDILIPMAYSAVIYLAISGLMQIWGSHTLWNLLLFVLGYVLYIIICIIMKDKDISELLGPVKSYISKRLHELK